MNVVLLQPEYAGQYRSLMLEAYELASDAFTSTPEERAAEPDTYWRKRISDAEGKSAAFGAFTDRDLVGTVALEFSTKPKTRHKALVIGMYVSPQARGKKVGKALIEAAIQYAEAKAGILLLNLTVTQGNEPAIRLYQGSGFQTFGIEPMAIRTPNGFKAKVHMQFVIGNAGTAA
jgi:GNAT superfamily N-acetyltransferase